MGRRRQCTVHGVLMEDKEMAGKLWDLANLLTAFSVVQSLTTMFAIVKGELDKWLVDPTAHYRALCGILLFTILYEIPVIYCGYKGRRLDPLHRSIWSTLTVGRSIAVLIFG